MSYVASREVDEEHSRRKQDPGGRYRTRELDRKAELIRLTRKGLGLASVELKEMMDPAYDLEAIRLEETRVLYGCKSRARR